MKKTLLNHQDLQFIIHGATFFASGGGGSKAFALDFLKQNEAIDTNEITLYRVKDAPPKATIAFVAEIYAPGHFSQQSPDLTGGENAYRNLLSKTKAITNEKSGVGPAEIGATSIALSLVIARNTNSFLIDASPVSRAVAELDMTTFANEHVSPSLTVVASGGNYADHYSNVFCAKNAKQAMQEISTCLNKHAKEYHDAAGFATYPMTTTALKDIPNLPKHGISESLSIGKASYNNDPSVAFTEVMKNLGKITHRDHFLLFSGKIHAINLKFDSKHNQTVGFIEFYNPDKKDEFLIVYAINENVLAVRETRKNKKVISRKNVCIGPDSINYLLTDSLYKGSITFSNSDILNKKNASLFKNAKIAIIGLACPDLRKNPAKQIFKEKIEQATGQPFNAPYKPIEQLNT